MLNENVQLNHMDQVECILKNKIWIKKNRCLTYSLSSLTADWKKAWRLLWIDVCRALNDFARARRRSERGNGGFWSSFACSQ